MKITACLSCVLLVIFSSQSFSQNSPRKSTPIIFDTDMGPDYDDVGAIAILHAMADSGQINILATIASTKYEGVAAVLNVFNTYFNRPQIPIGIPKGHGLELKDWQHWSDTLIVRYPHKIKTNNESQDATELYRKLLSKKPDHSVVIVTTGFLTNMADLLNSNADKWSKLSGTDLVKQKVKHLVCMAGRFPSGKEFNVERDAGASINIFQNWPTNIILSGFEIGSKIKTGLPIIKNESIKNSPVKDVFSISIPQSAEDVHGRMSWDETAVLVAIKGYRPWYNLEEGKIIVNNDGSNSWDKNGKGHFRLIEDSSPSVVEDLINHLIQHQPKKMNSK
ncbi:MAG: nucleoside hydrolase [Bacteroidetes bacterium]|nr:MAG: nucleoside hydrolase [Bacteroidota bacterium]